MAAQPTFEDLIIDDKLSELDRVVRYVNSSIGLQRLVHVKMIAGVAASFSFEQIVDSLVPLFPTIAKDAEPSIRRVFAAQLPMIANRCLKIGKDSGYRVLVDKILPIVATLLEDEKAEIRQTASSALVDISSMVTAEDLGIYVLTIILSLAHDDSNEEMRITASVLFNLLADTLGEDLCKQFVIPEVVSLAEDPGFRVRKTIALNFQHICKVGGEHELFERLMPAFVRLSKDDMFRVRRSCADSLASISEFVSEDIRIGVLVEIYLRLAQDPSKLVKQSIMQQSGMFIASLPSRVVNSTILDIYISLAYSPLRDQQADDELKKYCAYSFPGVLQAIGAERWAEIRQVYHSLVQSQIPAVMHTLGLSLHVVARLLGERIVEEELVPVFEEMIQDSDVVRLGIIKYLAEFLVLLSVPCRVSYLPLLNDLLQSANPLNWRLRESLANQLSSLMDLLPAQNLFGTLFPLTMALLQDPVFMVRRASYDGVVRMIMVLYINLESPLLPPPQGTTNADSVDLAGMVKGKTEVKDSELGKSSAKYLASVARAINALTFSESYQQRQAWAELSLALLREIPQHIFEMYFVESLILLASDPVPNVRIAAAQTLTGWAPYDYAPWETPEPTDPAASDTTRISPSLSRSHSGSGPTLKRSNSLEPEPPIAKRTDRPCPWKWLLARSDIKACIERLAVEDRDVYSSMSKLEPMFPAILFDRRSCRGLREAPGGPCPLPKRDRTLSMEERLLSQPAVTIDYMSRRNRASTDPANVPDQDREGVNEMAPWVERKDVRENVDDESIEKMFDISPTTCSDDRSRFLTTSDMLRIHQDEEDDEISPVKAASSPSKDDSKAAGIVMDELAVSLALDPSESLSINGNDASGCEEDIPPPVPESSSEISEVPIVIESTTATPITTELPPVVDVPSAPSTAGEDDFGTAESY